MVMTQQQVGVVAFLAMLAIALTMVTVNQPVTGNQRSISTGMAGEPVPGIPDPIFSARATRCTDADGDNAFSAGVTTVYAGRAIAVTHEDRCISERQLREWTCSGSAPVPRIMDCPFGCASGACTIS